MRHAALTILFLCAACGGGGGGDDDAGTDGARADGGGADGGGAADGSAWDGGGPDDGGADASGADGGPESCMTNDECRAGSYCAGRSCPVAGMCEERPMRCDPLAARVCGCDGTTYMSECRAAMAGVRVASPGNCACGLEAPTRCCDDDMDCMVGETCRLAACTEGDLGVCVPPPSSGHCWEDSDCLAGSCTGEQICACGDICIPANQEGTCESP